MRLGALRSGGAAVCHRPLRFRHPFDAPAFFFLLHSYMNHTQITRRLAGPCAYLPRFSKVSFHTSCVMAGKWSVQGLLIHVLLINANLDFISEHSRCRRSGERDRPGRVRECTQGHERHRPAPATRARSNHEEERYGSTRKARR